MNVVDGDSLRNICFWNAPPELKLLLAKVLSARDVRLIDVSPGPMLFDELEASSQFQKRIAFSAAEYIQRLDAFVSLYKGGLPESRIGARARKECVVPLGTPLPTRINILRSQAVRLPPGFDPRYSIGTCCRIVPDKRIEFLFDMMKALTSVVPKANLTIVGGPDKESIPYWENLLVRVESENIRNVNFVGWRDDVRPYLTRFKVFVMVSDRQGCPNASLEAMAMRLPVIANSSGGTAEQVLDGSTGYLADSPDIMAKRVQELLANPRLARAMGEAGYRVVRNHFSMSKMTKAFQRILQSPRRPS
jgi:glycosyltransferase involved in cell wall biosynthesis